VHRRTYLGTIGSVGTAAIAGCLDDGTSGSSSDGSDPESDVGSDPESNEGSPVGEWAGGNIEFGLPPFQNAEELLEEYSDVFEWLEGGFEGVDTVEGITTTSYSAVVESVVGGHTELANLSPVIYVLAVEDGVHPLVINWSHGSDAYHSYIATRAETDIETLSDIEGKTIAMVDPLSTSGGLFPRYMLSKAGLDAGSIDTQPGDFEIEWAFGHGASLEALQAGHVDAAAYGDFQHPDDPEIVKIAESDPIPFDPIVAKPETPEEVREALIERLIETPEEALEEHRIDKFGEIEPGTYDPVREVARELGIEIEDLEGDEG
jgi:phosphonate transport system substrate-binding protein